MFQPDIYLRIINYNKKPCRNYGAILINRVCKLFQILLIQVLETHHIFIYMKYLVNKFSIQMCFCDKLAPNGSFILTNSSITFNKKSFHIYINTTTKITYEEIYYWYVHFHDDPKFAIEEIKILKPNIHDLTQNLV